MKKQERKLVILGWGSSQISEYAAKMGIEGKFIRITMTDNYRSLMGQEMIGIRRFDYVLLPGVELLPNEIKEIENREGAQVELKVRIRARMVGAVITAVIWTVDSVFGLIEAAFNVAPKRRRVRA